MAIEYRTPAAADADALCAMARMAFTATFGHLYRAVDLAAFLAAKFGPTGLAAQVVDPRFAIRIACEGGDIVGFVKLGPMTLPPPAPRDGAIELHQLYLVPSHQGTGVGAALMDWAIATARGQGKSAMCLGVYVDNIRAQRFYFRYGFVAIGRYDFPVGEHIDDERILLLRL